MSTEHLKLKIPKCLNCLDNSGYVWWNRTLNYYQRAERPPLLKPTSQCFHKEKKSSDNIEFPGNKNR